MSYSLGDTIKQNKALLNTYKFADIQPIPRNIPCPAVEDVVCLQRGKHPQKEAWSPYQYCILEAW